MSLLLDSSSRLSWTFLQLLVVSLHLTVQLLQLMPTGRWSAGIIDSNALSMLGLTDGRGCSADLQGTGPTVSFSTVQVIL